MSPSFAVSTHLYHEHRLSRDHLVEIAAHGFEAVEVFANRPHFPYQEDEAFRDLEEALRDARLRLHSVHAPIAGALHAGRWTAPFSLAASDEGARAAAVSEVLSALALAKRTPFDWLVVHVGVPETQQRSPDDNRLDAARRSLETVQRAAEPLGVRLALEVMPNRLSGAEQLVSWLESDVDLPGAGICFDFGHAHLMGDVVEGVEIVSGHLVTTHVHDNDGRADDHRLPFDGGIPWEATLMAVRKVGYEGTFVLELAASATPRQVLERAKRVRTRFEQLLSV